MRLLFYMFFVWLLLWANVHVTSAQGEPIPAFPEIVQLDALLSSNSSQFYLKMEPNSNELLKKKTKRLNQWMVNLKEEDAQNIHFLIRSHKLKSLYEGHIHLTEAGEWEITIDKAMPGQAVILLFVADHLLVNKGRMAIRPERDAYFSESRIAAGKKMVEEMHALELSLDLERWSLAQLRKFGDTGNQLPELRQGAAAQLKLYLQAALQAN